MQVSELRGYHKNPRRGNVKLIQESLEGLGQYRSIVVNKGTHTGRANEVLVGNHTFQAAKANGLTELECKVVDVDDQTAAKIVLADNRTSDSGTYDDEALLDLLESLDELDYTGYTDSDVDDLLVSLEPPMELESLAGSEDRFAGTSMRAMYVEFPVEEYIEVQNILFKLSVERGLTSNAAVVAQLAWEAVQEL